MAWPSQVVCEREVLCRVQSSRIQPLLKRLVTLYGSSNSGIAASLFNSAELWWERLEAV